MFFVNKVNVKVDFDIVEKLNIDVLKKVISVNTIDDKVYFTLQIPSIDLEKDVYCMDSNLNNVDLNIEILEKSNFDDNLLFLAAHSGNGKANYFNRLKELSKGDVIFLKFWNDIKIFVVEECFLIDKNGYFVYDDYVDILYLITCSLEDNNKQFIVKARYIKK